MGHDWIRIGYVCCVLLLVFLVFPSSPLSDRTVDGDGRYEHTVEPVGSEAYQERLDEITGPDGNASDLRQRSYANLSPAAREIFDRTLENEPSSDGAYAYTPTLCRDDAVACPYRDRGDLPPEFSYEPDAPPADSAIVVHTADGTYLYSTGAATMVKTDGGFEEPIAILGVLFVLPYILFVGALESTSTRRGRWKAAALLATPIVLVPFAMRVANLPIVAGIGMAGVLLLAAPLQVLSVPREPDRWFRVGAVVAGVAGALAMALIPYADVYLWPRTASVGPGLIAIGILWVAGPVLRSIDLLRTSWERFDVHGR